MRQRITGNCVCRHCGGEAFKLVIDRIDDVIIENGMIMHPSDFTPTIAECLACGEEHHSLKNKPGVIRLQGMVRFRPVKTA